ncbi:hypothetical protein AC578_8307 [Pseudocercospora eumusae]|uniref:C2H2-type domain-containing protein n=1 Tax=Pseudocercospora eumusae TaxID=321146 RepID=A0A139H302_9PEZI|nr:hypothetical protein AC578_8307 [Pseudocercospora eumusae]
MDFQTIPPSHLHPHHPQAAPLFYTTTTNNNSAPLVAIAEENAHHIDVKTEYAHSEDSHSNSDGPSPDTNLPPNKRARINYECDACGTTYTEKRALARHRHTDMHRRRLGLQPDKRHLCLKCGRSFGRNHDLQRHRREQHGEATGANPIDLSSVASDASEHKSLSSDESGKSMSGYSMASTMTAMTIPDDLPPPSHLRSTRSLADIRKPGESKSSRSGSMDWSYTPVKVEASPPKTTIEPWPGEPAEHEYTYQALVEPPSRKTKKPSRRHSSASLREEKPPPPPSVSISPPESVSSRPSSSSCRSRATSSRPTLSKESSRDFNAANEVIEQVLNPKPKPKKPRETVVKSSIPLAPRDVESWLSSEPKMCIICGKPFENDETLLDHLQLHLETFKGKHKCKKCQVGFDHEADLQKHLDSAARGHCGFNFEHIAPCTGHHPPSKEAEEGRLSDPDCFRLWHQLRNWEQAQLQAYIAEINDLMAARDNHRKNRWSVEALFRNTKRNSSHSFSSFALSVNTYASAPCDETNGDMDINGLQKRMKKLSIKHVGANVKHMWGGGKYHPTKPLPPPSAIYDKTLYRAIHRGDLKRAEDLLNSGEADQSSLGHADGTLTAAALWNHSEIQSLVVAHRLTEDMQGSCDTCRMNSAVFQKGNNKIKSLLSHGASVSAEGGLCGFPILSAAWLCNDEVVKMLIQKGASVNQRDKDGRFGSPLAIAASQAGHPGSLEVVEVLLNAGANPDIGGADGKPLQLVKRRKQFWEQCPGVMLQLCPEEVNVRVESCNQIIKKLEYAGARR